MTAEVTSLHQKRCESWPQRFPAHQWTIYKRVIEEANRRGLRFAVGGGFATITYTGRWRNTKDLDLFVPGDQRDALVKLLHDCGLDDYYDQMPYDRGWIYRSFKEDIIIDVIWRMANKRAPVDEGWLTRGPEVEVENVRFRLAPPEETLWAKLYVLQRDRCDWPDSLALLYSVGAELDWKHLIDRLGEDTPLLGGLLCVFGWVCPDRAQALPPWIWGSLQARHPDSGSCDTVAGDRAELLDSRPWFTPTLDEEERTREC